MRDYPKKKKKKAKVNQSVLSNFDSSILTEADKEVLELFKSRRSKIEELLTKSNIIYHKSTCPSCAFPTIDEPYNYEVCILCLWEDGINENKPNVISYPNYISLTEARVSFGTILSQFTKNYAIDFRIDGLIKSIKSFEESLKLGTSKVDEENAIAHIKNILPTIDKESDQL